MLNCISTLQPPALVPKLANNAMILSGSQVMAGTGTLKQHAVHTRCQIHWCLIGSSASPAAPSNSWNFCSTLSWMPPAASLSLLWNTAACGASWNALRSRTLSFSEMQVLPAPALLHQAQLARQCREGCCRGRQGFPLAAAELRSA